MSVRHVIARTIDKPVRQREIRYQLRERAIALCQYTRGMCSDEEPHHLIDGKLAEIRDLLYELRELESAKTLGEPVDG